MSKFEELCQAYAASKKADRESRQACLEFSEIFIKQLTDYFGCSIDRQQPWFDDNGFLHFDLIIQVFENPANPETGDRETVKISLTLEKVIDNYVVTVWPLGHEFKILIDEPKHFEEAFEYIFDYLKSGYTGRSELASREDPLPF
ncbi:MAG: hypothetical protein MUE44_00010 [Oscillatoriaceae cyanobacterium Prado104]|jgi:hypothetical protein|nr:hypothetical protein [Oscillatoriaceae cyanobacterium Prado104]